jgi:hypothetical protein
LPPVFIKVAHKHTFGITFKGQLQYKPANSGISSTILCALAVLLAAIAILLVTYAVRAIIQLPAKHGSATKLKMALPAKAVPAALIKLPN